MGAFEKRILSIFLGFCFIGCFSLAREIYFEGGPAFYDLLYIDPLTKKPWAELSSPRMQIVKNISAWMEEYQKRGVNIFTLPVFDREGVTICDSAMLSAAGFRYIQDVGDILPLILLEAKKKSLGLLIPIEDLFHIVHSTKHYKEWLNPTKITLDSLAEFIREIGTYGKAYNVKIGISQESFGPESRAILAKFCKQNDVFLIRYGADPEGGADIFYSADYATYPSHAESKKEDADYLVFLARLGTSSLRLGCNNLIFGLAKTFRKETGVVTTGGWGLTPGCEINIALYRCVQFSPSFFSFFPAFYEEAPYENEQDAKFMAQFHYTKNLLPLIQKFSSQEKDKPFANVILDLPNPAFDSPNQELWESALTSSMEAITNAITAAGMDLFVSIRKPLPKAALYYIFTAGSDPKSSIYRDVGPEILEIFPSQALVFFQVALGLPRGNNFRKIAPYFSLPEENIPLVASNAEPLDSPISQECRAFFPQGEFTLFYRGYQFEITQSSQAGKLATWHYLTDLPLAESQAPPPSLLLEKSDNDAKKYPQVFLSGKKNNKTYRLWTKNQNYSFLNGNFIHFAISPLLCNFIAHEPVFLRPSPIYLTCGKTRSALFAADDASVALVLSQSKQACIYHWRSDGTPYEKSSLTWDGKVLEGKVQKWELVILDECNLK